jgi:NitT/TauT family transport system permease protein
LVVGLLLAWEWGVYRRIISPLYFPAPFFILNTIIKQMIEGPLLEHAVATLWRMFWGLLAGGLAGLVLGLAMGWSRRLRMVLDPLVAAIHPLPKIALLPLIMVIFGVGDLSCEIVIATRAFLPVRINKKAGVAQIQPIYFEVAQNYQASLFKIFLRIIWPGSLPLVLVGLRLALNTTLLLAVAVEMVGAQTGLGAMIWMAWSTMRVEEVYVSLSIILMLGILMNLLLNYADQRWVPWQVSSSI